MTLQSKRKTIGLRRFILTPMLLILASVSAAAQTNTFPTTGNAGAGTTSPDRKLEVLDSGSPQIRLTHTDGSVYTDFQTLSTGNLLISPTGPDVSIIKPISIAADSDAFRFYPNANTNLRWSLSTDASGLFHIVQKGDGWANQDTRLSINRSGNVGIGTATPGATLNIPTGNVLLGASTTNLNQTTCRLIMRTGTNQNICFESSYNANSASLGVANDANTAFADFQLNANNLLFFGNNSERMRITSTGNVGIGTSSPAYKLDVAGEIRSNSGGFRFPDGSLQTTAASGGGGGVTSVFGRTGAVVAATNDYTWAQINKTTSSLADITTRSASDLSSGTLPDARFPATLPAISGANLTLLNANNLATGLVNPARLGSGTANNTTFLRGDNTWAAITSSQWTTNGTNINYAGSGNVGIGTTSPSYPLTIVKDHNGPTSIALFNTADGATAQASAGISRTMNWSSKYISWGVTAPSFSSPGYGETAYFQSAGVPLKFGSKTDNDILFFTNGISNTRMTITGGGNVGIGTTPGALYRLDVQGKINSSELCIATDCKSSWSQVGGGGGPTSFSSITPGTNTVALVVGSGGSLGVSDTGTINATSLTNAANITGGTVPTARLGSGTANNTTFLRGDNTWAAITSSQWSAAGTNNINYGASGNVGIGVGTPSSKLDVNGNINVSGTGNITATGTIEAGNIKAKYQDLAEWVPSSEQLSAGTVVVLDTTKSNQVVSSGTAYDTRVAGVISAQPGITLGESGAGKVLVATTGRVRVKVDASRGPIQIGDLLVTSDVLGVAMKSEPVEFAGRKMHMPGTIIGKALEPLAKGSGEILVLLSLQ